MTEQPGSVQVDMDNIPPVSYQINLYPVQNDYIASIGTTNFLNSTKSQDSKAKTVIILDRSGSMGTSVQKIIQSVLPIFFEKLNYNPEEIINLIAFESSTEMHEIKVRDFKKFEMYCAGGTSMAPAVIVLQKLFEQFQGSITSLRILTISDGVIFDQDETKLLGDELANYASKCNILVNSQAVRLFTSKSQPDTTALCSLLQLNNFQKSQMLDIESKKHHEIIATKMADLFINDGLDGTKILKSNNSIFRKYPWEVYELAEVLIIQTRKNIFWLSKIPTDEDFLTIDDVPVKVSIKKINFDILQSLVNAKLDYIFDHLKILKIVDTDSAKVIIQKTVEYFSQLENLMESLITDVPLDNKSLASRTQILKFNRIKSKKITTFLETIANDDKVSGLNSAQKAAYLRSVQASSKSGKGLAKRATKKKSKIGVNQLSFDEIVRNEIIKIKDNFDEIKDIDHKNHSVSFYSQATTIEGIKAVVELTNDSDFAYFSADDILQIINIVGIACNGPIGDFPDASSWRINEIFYGCNTSAADIITSFHQSADSQFTLKAPGFDKEITNAIPIFDDLRIGVFLKKYAPSILEYTSSIGMRRIIADVPMTFGFTIIAGIRRMIYDLNKNKSTVHIEAFKQLVDAASSFVGKYYDHIEELLTDQECGLHSYYLGNNGIANIIVPLIRVYHKGNKDAIKRSPDILRSLYSCEIWKGINKEFKGKQKFNEIVKDMIYKLLNIDIEKKKIRIRPLFETEPNMKDIEFPEEFEINQEYLESLTKPLYYHNYMSLLPKFLVAAINGPLEIIKDIPEMNKASILEAFGIDYSYKEFLFLNVFQALCYPRNSARANTATKTMKIVDVKNYNEAMGEVKSYVRKQFENLYDFELKAKRRNEQSEMAAVIVDRIINETNYEEMVNVWKNGIDRNGVVYKIKSSSSCGFKLLCRKLVDTKILIPLRADIIKILLLCIDDKNEVVYNNGRICDLKNIKKFKKRYLLTSTVEKWNEIEEIIRNKEVHKYRDGKNRQGHGNDLPSYWALGFNNSLDYFKSLNDDEAYKYYANHSKCCGAQNIYWNLKYKMRYNDLYYDREEAADDKENEELDIYVESLKTLFIENNNDGEIEDDNDKIDDYAEPKSKNFCELM